MNEVFGILPVKLGAGPAKLVIGIELDEPAIQRAMQVDAQRNTVLRLVVPQTPVSPGQVCGIEQGLGRATADDALATMMRDHRFAERGLFQAAQRQAVPFFLPVTLAFRSCAVWHGFLRGRQRRFRKLRP
ncbi:hypothetical protein WK80_23425 [Burkholderia multivorans]|uniref:hypothetical protein n=1 Tax=Burkholderia cepacia complex TaxID=87882 RepID=UPI0007569E21|nr:MULTISPECIES: hypothetical protein [Burkholderia cepacia complex]KVV21680.1 hypothetical protein WK80_23425 [Burkholderia multivorans]MCA7888630.1 hypothetical protein [Burkholderia contaminans]MDN7576825.1 hypothetical protein [Burkholderia contaminans]PRF33413.1 hypothetical protein C6Q10_25730 [Burkholderia multivorans]